MKKVILFLVILLLIKEHALAAQPYCFSDDFFSIEHPDSVLKPNENPLWIIFHLNKASPEQSSVETLELPIRYVSRHSESDKPKLLDLLCMPNHLRFSIGTKLHSEQIIYDVADQKTTLLIREKLRTYLKGSLQYLGRNDKPASRTFGDNLKIKVQFSEAFTDVTEFGRRVNRKLSLSAEEADGSLLNEWVLWSTSFEESIDPY